MKLTFSHITKKFDNKTAVNDFSYSFEVKKDHSVLAVRGPSGCGKSTLLSILAGLDKKYQGKLSFENEKPTISISFQKPRLLPHLTAAQNVALVEGDNKEAVEKAKDILCELGLEDFCNSLPDELSGGMQARVAIARALIRPADIYILDEPFSSLDEETATRCMNVIRKYTKGAAVIAVIHSPETAKEFADEILTFTSSPAEKYSLQTVK